MELTDKELRTLNLALQTAEYAMIRGTVPCSIEEESQINALRKKVQDEQAKRTRAQMVRYL